MHKSEPRQDGRASRKSAPKKSRKANAPDSIDIMTHEEVRLMSTGNRQSGTAMELEGLPIANNIGAAEEGDEDYDMGDLKKDTQNKDRLSQVINQLLLKNKINLKNAFDVPLISLESLSQFQKTSIGDGAWKKLSSTLEADSKIFGFRVDSVHSDTCKIISGLSRTDKEEHREETSKPANGNFFGAEFNVEAFGEALNFNVGGGTIEKQQSNINVENIQYQFDFNPFFERTKRTFDEGGTKGLLMNSLKIDRSMRWMLDCGEISGAHEFNERGSTFEYGSLITLDRPLGIFKKVEELKMEINAFSLRVTGQSFTEQIFEAREENSGRMIAEEQTQHRSHHNSPSKLSTEHPMEAEQLNPEKIEQKEQPDKGRKLAALQNKAKKIGTMESYEDYEKDAKKWMSKEELKMVRMDYQGVQSEKPDKHEKIPRNVSKALQAYILFDYKDTCTRLEVLQSISEANIKNTDNEPHGDFNLLPMNLHRTIDQYGICYHSNIKLSMKEAGPIEPEGPSDEPFANLETIEEVKANENKKSQASIKQIKEQLKLVLQAMKTTTSPSFVNSYKSLKLREGDVADITVQTAFVTFLHLANENNLALRNLENEDFIISK